MIKIKGSVCLIGIISFVLLLLGCLIKNKEKVIITRDYIINPNWNEVNNYLTVYKMKLKDSDQTIDLTDPSEAELYHGLVKDSSFLYSTNIRHNGEDYTKRKVYFNKYNGFFWRNPPYIDTTRDITYETIGELKQETWYVFYGLSNIHTTAYYAYFDASDKLHLFVVGMMTNY